ncbi:MAG: OmpA family protein [Desulfobacterales bacterium]|nr:OmpA family protein [Desulfobacterales bacterium]
MKTILRHLVLCFALTLIVSCGYKERTTVILLPQDDGQTGSVVVRNQAFATRLDKPYTYTQAASDTQGFVVEKADPKEINTTYAQLFAQEPAKPVHFILYFDTDSVRLTPASMDLLPLISQSARERAPSEISIIGHADSQGSPAYNMALSLERAKAVAGILARYDTGLRQIYVQGYGEYDLLVPTPDETPEPRNRRVEIMIR